MKNDFQLNIFNQSDNKVSEKISEQVLIRLIMSGMYPLHRNSGGWMYFITEKGEYIGTPKDDDFKAYWKEETYFLGEGQMTEEEIFEVRKTDYLLTDEYKLKFEKWKANILATAKEKIQPIIDKINSK